MVEIKIDPLAQRYTRTSAKWRGLPNDVLPLPVAEMDFHIAEPIRAKLHEMVESSDLGYGGLIPEYAKSFAEYSLKHWDWVVDQEQFTITTDVGVAGVEVLRVLTNPGDGVVINSPVYHNFYNWIKEAQCTAVDVPLNYVGDGVWDLDFERLEQAFAAGAKVFLLCNPHNPVGTVFCQEHLEQVADLADRYGVTVISDEIHAPLNYTSTPFKPYLAVNEKARSHGVCVTSASKAWNLAGLKCAHIVTADTKLDEVMKKLPMSVPWRASILGSWASTVAYNEGQPWLDEVMKILNENREWLEANIAQRLPRAVYHKPESTYLAWIDLNGYGLDDPAKLLLEKGRVAFNNGADFGPDGRNFIRLNFATDIPTLDEALERMAHVLEN